MSKTRVRWWETRTQCAIAGLTSDGRLQLATAPDGTIP